MAFFKSFQQNLPSVSISSILDTVSSKVDDLANAVSDVTYAVSDQLSEQVSTIINKVQEEEDGDQDWAQDGKAASRSLWPETSSKSKNNSSGDVAEAECEQSQLEWEWRDGCWRVKKTEAELAEEERRKKEEKELLEEREMRRKERREKRLEKAGVTTKNQEPSKEGQEEQTEADELKKTGQEARQGEDATQPGGRDACDESPPSSGAESERTFPEHEEEKNERDDEERYGLDREGDDEDAPDAPQVKKKKLDKKKEKAAKKAEKKEKDRKRKKKDKSKREAILTESEEERDPEPAVQSTTAACRSKNKEATEQEGDSSEASDENASSRIQKLQKTPSLAEGRPPPYQDRVSVACVSSSRSRVGGGSSPQRCSSEASVDQDTKSYLNKGCEEDSTAVMGPEDSSGPPLPSAYEPEPLAKYGTLDVAFEYDSNERWLAVTVTAATDIPALKQAGNISWQVHLVLLPTKKQRAKTGVQKGPCPVFTETFKFSRVEQEVLSDCAVRFRLYSIRRMKKEKVLGEKVFHLTKLNLQGKIALPVTLEPGSELTGCGSMVSVSRSAGAVSYRSTEDSSSPEILLGLVYNSATGHLSAEVIQGSHFKSTASDKPVTFRWGTALYHERHLRHADHAGLQRQGDVQVQDGGMPWAAQPLLQRNLRLPGGALPAD
ncbi:synaptotagmin-14b isoform X3 [Hippocampus zosterae]|uniref:synaptotagmin-14b isoform X3 n=1 Tax=Hippocampus zosterae TaxID=109293 RepID=UPI00223E0861|nr:synaptotagmin-14b isoform X3 [Hippocampus zosterae]